ncbi:MAG: hypothetical protein VW226_05305 [Rhodospirillaceae bacterium]
MLMELFRRLRAKIICHLALLVVVGLLGGCQGVFENKKPLPCPVVTIVDQARSFSEKIGKGDKDDQIKGEIVDIKGTCVYPSGKVEIDLSLAISFKIVRNKFDRKLRVKFGYFVAIPKFHPEPAGKRVFLVTVDFDKGEQDRRVVEEISVRIPISKGSSAYEYPIFIGYDLGPEQVNAGRHKN